VYNVFMYPMDMCKCLIHTSAVAHHYSTSYYRPEYTKRQQDTRVGAYHF